MRIWDAICNRLEALINPKATEALSPTYCQCQHPRCTHVRGKGKCKGAWELKEKDGVWTGCSCQIFIEDDDEDDDDAVPDEPTPEDLEALSLLVN